MARPGFYDIDSGMAIGRLRGYGMRAVSAAGDLATGVTIQNVSVVHGDLLTRAWPLLVWDVGDEHGPWHTLWVVGRMLNRAPLKPRGSSLYHPPDGNFPFGTLAKWR